jgi:hypothetical protein
MNKLVTTLVLSASLLAGAPVNAEPLTREEVAMLGAIIYVHQRACPDYQPPKHITSRYSDAMNRVMKDANVGMTDILVETQQQVIQRLLNMVSGEDPQWCAKLAAPLMAAVLRALKS